MKKSLLLTIMAVFIISLTACTQQPAKRQEKHKMKTLIAYFSATGTTEKVAKQLAEITGGDLHKIEPEKPYNHDDLDWNNKSSRSSIEMSDLSSRPSIANKLSNISDYDIIYVGFPIWWYTAPTIINTFMESYDFVGKTIIPFATSGGSSIKKSCDDLKKSYPNLKWGEGKLLNNPSKKNLKDFVKQIK